MEKNKSRLLYEERVYIIQDYISHHLHEELNLEKIAKISAFSPYHFHRIFKSITGETLYGFIQRIRLEKACSLLKSDINMKIINIAMDCGFATHSSFAKAFKQQYNISPSVYRNGKKGLHNSKNGASDSNGGRDSGNSFEYISDKAIEALYERRKRMNVLIEEMAPYRTAYMRHIGPYGTANIQLMQKLKKWAVTRDLLTDSAIILGIAHDDPELTPPEHCRYDCAIALKEDYELESGMVEARLPGGKYAILSVEHTTKAIGKAWEEIFSLWLPDSGYQIDDRPIFERYMGTSSDVIMEPQNCEICIPVKVL